MPKKYLGQHFLKNSAIAKRIVNYADVGSKDIVLEIGPGKGILTNELAKRAKKVIAIEKDRELAEELMDNIGAGSSSCAKIKVICGDALKVKWPKFDKIAANLPYNISSPIVFKIFEHKWKTAVLMFQREFAERFIAKPCSRNYSRLTIAVNYYSKPEILERISSDKFYPKPKVESAVARLTPKEPEFETNKEFWDFVKELFRHKRKLVRAALKVSDISAGSSSSRKNDISASRISTTHILTKLPEELAKKRVVCCELEDLKRIFESLYN